MSDGWGNDRTFRHTLRMHQASKRLWRVLVRTVLFATLSVLIALLASAGFILSDFSGTATLPADCGIVFGAAVYGSRPSMAVQRRIDAAVALYRRHLITRIFMTGGKAGGDRLSEAAVMRARAIHGGVDPRDIVTEDRARSTWENLLFTRPLTESCGTVVAISDAFHLARIGLLARRQGWGTLQTFPAARPSSFALEARGIGREVLGVLYYAFHVDILWNIAPTATYLESSRSATPAVLVN